MAQLEQSYKEPGFFSVIKNAVKSGAALAATGAMAGAALAGIASMFLGGAQVAAFLAPVIDFAGAGTLGALGAGATTGALAGAVVGVPAGSVHGVQHLRHVKHAHALAHDMANHPTATPQPGRAFEYPSPQQVTQSSTHFRDQLEARDMSYGAQEKNAESLLTMEVRGHG